ncbi:MAG: calcium/sodium antiporter [Gammaproteobacteria bacterium]|jgi:cation:H+ antiporter
MLTSVLGLCFGIVLLLVAGTALVSGASSIAARFGVSPAVVGLTIVAFGTSAPELVVNIAGAIRNETALAFGNVVGSNLANLGLVLGLAAIFRPVEIHGRFVLRELPLFLLATAMILVLSIDPILRDSRPLLDRSDGVAILLLFLVFLYISILDVFRPHSDDVLLSEIEAIPVISKKPRMTIAWALTVFGIAGLFWGGDVTVDNGVALSAELAISSAIVGLFVVAVGTSLPELITSIIAALRGESDLALGNVIGSNIFNSLFVLPLSAIATPIDIPRGGLLDLGSGLVLASVIVLVFSFGRLRLNRFIGAAMLSSYLAYALFRFVY